MSHGSETPYWSPDMRAAGDPAADEAIQAIAASGRLDDVNRVMHTLIENDDFPTAHLPPAIASYMEETSVMPTWAEPDRLLRGSRLFERYGPEIVLMLFGASLPNIYAAHPGCEVLGSTKRMTDHVHRRIIETGQFVVDVTEPEAWTPTGRGILTSQKVRLMHAAIRHYLTAHERWQEHWRPEWGMPICQEDLVGTILSFSVTVLQCLEKSAITLTLQEKEDYLHLWMVVGALLGIEERHLPGDYAEACRLMEEWMRRNHRPNETSVALMGAMVDFWYRRVPGRIFDGVTSGWCRLWLGDELADHLEVPPFNWTRRILSAQIAMWKHEDRLADSVVPFRTLTRLWSRTLLRALLRMERDGKRPDFRIPAQLQHAWGIS